MYCIPISDQMASMHLNIMLCTYLLHIWENNGFLLFQMIIQAANILTSTIKAKKEDLYKEIENFTC